MNPDAKSLTKIWSAVGTISMLTCVSIAARMHGVRYLPFGTKPEETHSYVLSLYGIATLLFIALLFYLTRLYAKLFGGATWHTRIPPAYSIEFRNPGLSTQYQAVMLGVVFDLAIPGSCRLCPEVFPRNDL